MPAWSEPQALAHQPTHGPADNHAPSVVVAEGATGAGATGGVGVFIAETSFASSASNLLCAASSWSSTHAFIPAIPPSGNPPAAFPAANSPDPQAFTCATAAATSSCDA